MFSHVLSYILWFLPALGEGFFIFFPMRLKSLFRLRTNPSTIVLFIYEPDQGNTPRPRKRTRFPNKRNKWARCENALRIVTMDAVNVAQFYTLSVHSEWNIQIPSLIL